MDQVFICHLKPEILFIEIRDLLEGTCYSVTGASLLDFTTYTVVVHAHCMNPLHSFRCIHTLCHFFDNLNAANLDNLLVQIILCLC